MVLGRFMNVGGEDIGYKWGKLNLENMVLSGKIVAPWWYYIKRIGPTVYM